MDPGAGVPGSSRFHHPSTPVRSYFVRRVMWSQVFRCAPAVGEEESSDDGHGVNSSALRESRSTSPSIVRSFPTSSSNDCFLISAFPEDSILGLECRFGFRGINLVF